MKSQTQGPRQLIRSRIGQLTLPDHQNPPAQSLQLLIFRGVSNIIFVEFFLPIVLVTFRQRQVAFWASMPKTTMDENGQSPTGVRNIRSTDVPPFFIIYPPMKPVSWETRFSECCSYADFGRSVLAFVTLHYLSHGRG